LHFTVQKLDGLCLQVRPIASLATNGIGRSGMLIEHINA
jgi:hypothetical protein